MRGGHGTPVVRAPPFFAVLAIRRFRPGGEPGASSRQSCISSLSARGAGWPSLKWLQHNATPKEPQMITAFFVFVTTAFFVAIVANVAESVSTARFA